jgi:uncharacterized protein
MDFHSPSVLSVADLVDRPGHSRKVDLRLDVPEDLGRAVARVRGPLRFVGVLESVVDGVLVRGVLEASVELDCARCLTPVREAVRVDVAELFALEGAQPDQGEPLDDGYEVSDGLLDLETLLRDALMPAVPYQPLCRPDCQGLCPHCGIDRNAARCACADEHTDARWSALEGLRLPDPPS